MTVAQLATSLRTSTHASHTLFLLPEPWAGSPYALDHIRHELELLLMDFTVEEVPKKLWKTIEALGGAKVLHALWVSGRKVETVRSIIKAAFWPPPRPAHPIPYAGLSAGSPPPPPPDHAIGRVGWFIPAKEPKRKQLECRSLDHKQIYRLRFDYGQLDRVTAPLGNYVRSMVHDCPNHLFLLDGLRCSSFPGHLATELTHHGDHEVSQIARESHHHERFKSRHENCQYHFLTSDPFTVAVELPVWIEEEDLADFTDAFGARGPLTGHVDLVREKGGLVEVWDYKPRARHERTAATQVYLYTLALALRTGIPLTRFACGYFDEHDCYTFSPLRRSLLV